MSAGKRWTCTKCEQVIDDDFAVCWNCGTGSDGTPASPAWHRAAVEFLEPPEPPQGRLAIADAITTGLRACWLQPLILATSFPLIVYERVWPRPARLSPAMSDPGHVDWTAIALGIPNHLRHDALPTLVLEPLATLIVIWLVLGVTRPSAPIEALRSIILRCWPRLAATTVLMTLAGAILVGATAALWELGIPTLVLSFTVAAVVLVVGFRWAFVDQAIVVGHAEPTEAFGLSWRMMDDALLSVVLLAAVFWLPELVVELMLGGASAGVLSDLLTPAWAAVLTAAYLQLDHPPQGRETTTLP